MKRNQTFHETLIPLLVEGLGCDSYLEFGTHKNETIGKVRCGRRIGVDLNIIHLHELNALMFEMSTQEFIKDFAKAHAPYDFVFIDADHSEEAVRRDFEGIWPYVTPEGIICLHDTNPETKADAAPGLCGDAWRFAYGLCEGKQTEAVTLPYHPGLTIVRKRIWWGPA